MRRAAVILAGGLAGWFAATSAGQTVGDAVARVEAYLGSLKTLSADFSQVVRDRDGRIVDRASGTLSLSRPNRFRWDYTKPYLQTIVADGERLWLYDSELEQVTVRALEAGLGSTPAMLLSGAGRIADAFESLGSERAGEWTWYRLRPKQSGSDFESVGLAFGTQGELAAMELRDKLGQTTVIEFGRLRRNPALDATLFRFDPPPGADVIGRAAP
jgi:outer membrane lipoprotein carrier protein